MELTKDISMEALPSAETAAALEKQRKRLKNLTAEEINEQLEAILAERIRSGDNTALFQLGQLHFEQVSFPVLT